MICECIDYHDLSHHPTIFYNWVVIAHSYSYHCVWCSLRHLRDEHNIPENNLKMIKEYLEKHPEEALEI